MKLSNKAYDILKWVCIILLPALGTLYGILADAWGLPYSEPILKTLDGAGLFIGTLIGVSTYRYNRLGDSDVERDDAPNADIVSHEDIDGVG